MYQETNWKLCKDYFWGLPIGLQKTMVQMEPMDQYQELSDWKEGVIDTNFLPIIMRSLNWDEQTKQTIAQIATEPITEAKKEQIVEELQEECSPTASITTELAQDAKQYTKEVPIPDEYQQHWKVWRRIPQISTL